MNYGGEIENLWSDVPLEIKFKVLSQYSKQLGLTKRDAKNLSCKFPIGHDEAQSHFSKSGVICTFARFVRNKQSRNDPVYNARISTQRGNDHVEVTDIMLDTFDEGCFIHSDKSVPANQHEIAHYGKLFGYDLLTFSGVLSKRSGCSKELLKSECISHFSMWYSDDTIDREIQDLISRLNDDEHARPSDVISFIILSLYCNAVLLELNPSKDILKRGWLPLIHKDEIDNMVKFLNTALKQLRNDVANKLTLYWGFNPLAHYVYESVIYDRLQKPLIGSLDRWIEEHLNIRGVQYRQLGKSSYSLCGNVVSLDFTSTLDGEIDKVNTYIYSCGYEIDYHNLSDVINDVHIVRLIRAT